MTDQNYTDFRTLVMIARTSSPYGPRCGTVRSCGFSSRSQRGCLEWDLVQPQLAANGREQPGRKTEGHLGERCADPQLCLSWKSLANLRTLAQSGQPEVQYRSRGQRGV